MGWDSPGEASGNKITSPSGYAEGEITEVVKDNHEIGSQRKIGPVAMDYNPTAGLTLVISLAAEVLVLQVIVYHFTGIQVKVDFIVHGVHDAQDGDLAERIKR